VVPRAALPVALALLLLAGVGGSRPAAAAAPPALPVGEDGRFLTNLSAPVLAPGSSGSVGYRLQDPLPGAMTDVNLTFEIYAFTASPGGRSGGVPNGSLTFPGTPSPSVVALATFPDVAPGAGARAGSVAVAAGGGAGDGSYAIRVALAFTENGSRFLLESRGYFSDAQWEAATLANGSDGPPTLNVTRLGVSGVVPETAVGVDSDPWTVPVLALTALGLLLAGAGAFVYFRRGPGSSSGARSPPAPQSAPSAAGK